MHTLVTNGSERHHFGQFIGWTLAKKKDEYGQKKTKKKDKKRWQKWQKSITKWQWYNV